MTPLELQRAYDEHADALFGFLLQLIRDEADACDAVQEVFRKLWLKPEAFEGVRDQRGFVLRMGHNQAIDLIRRRDSRRRTTDAYALETLELFASVPNLDEAAFARELEGALAELPEEQRAVVHLKLWEGLTFERIATVLGVSSNTAASRYRYAIDKLRVRLRPLYEEIR